MMLGCLAEAVGGALFELLLRLLLTAAVLTLATPCILIGALFGSDTYLANVRASYSRVMGFCRRNLLLGL
jgi:hypothetical protein